MNISNIKCPHCGQYLVSISGIGDEHSELICENLSCPEKHTDVVCPKCKSTSKKVVDIGFNTFEYTCNNCNHTWANQ